MSNTRRLSRRRLLRRSALSAAAAMGLPLIVPRRALSVPGRPGANDKIGIGYIGVGRRGCQLMGLPKETQLVAAADVLLERAEKIGQRFNATPYKDYRRLLEQKDVDAVVVATPDHWRALTSIHACQAGKHVYGEKPLTLTIAEGRKMVEAARKYNCVYQTGSQQRSMAPNRIGCELVRNGVIGKVHTVLGCNYPSPWECALPGQPVPDGLDWDFWCGPTEPVPYHIDIFTPRKQPGWISFRPYSGGEMTGWGSHGLDQVQWALGMDDTGPVEIWVEGPEFDPPTFTEPAPRSAGDAQTKQPIIHYKYANGVVLKLEGGPGGGAVFIGDKGKIIINRNSYKVDPAELADGPLENPKVALAKSDNHMQNWVDCIKSGKRPIADVEIGHRSATVCHLGNIARLLGRRLHWDPKSEQFRGDEEANALVDRKRRKQYDLPDQV